MAQNWEGRQWITHGFRDPDTPKLRVLSYHIFADYNKCASIQYSSTRNWETRKTKLLQEILSYQPSIVCLQDLDHLNDWWQPMLAQNGYDICVCQKTRFRETTDVEFVAVVYKTTDFQLFKSIHVELNKCADTMRDAPSSLKDRCRTDDVGLIAFLQPWGTNETMKTALCVASCSIADRAMDEDVRQHQTEYFARQVEIANSEFSLPVIMGMSLHDTPTSPAYHILRTGRVPLQPRAPGKCPVPSIDPICRGSVRVRWFSPPVSNADPPIQYYRIAWCPGGSKTLSYKAHIDISAGDCIQYRDVADKKGRIRSVAVEELSYVVSGLSSELAYEFKVTAINKVGVGKSSEASLPLMLVNPPKAPRQPALVNLLGPRQVREAREVEAMELEDWNVLSMTTFDAHNAETKLTPRNLIGGVHADVTRGRAVLPLHINPRQGWRGGKYLGQGSEALQQELNAERVLRKSIIRTRDGFSHKVADFPDGKQADIIDYDLVLGEFLTANNERQRIFELEAAAALEHENRLLNGIKDSPRSECSRSNSPVLFARSPDDAALAGATSGLAAFSVTSADSRVKALRFDDIQVAQGGGSEGSKSDSQQDPLAQHVGGGSVFSADDDAGSDGWDEEEDDDISSQKERASAVELQQGSSLAGGSMGSADLRGASTCSMASGSSYVITENSVEYPLAEEDAVDDVVLDCRDVVYDVGKNTQRQVHALNLRSAYEYYSCAGEPLFTKSEPVEPAIQGTANANAQVVPGVSCADYIFYSASYLQMTCLLSLPTLAQLRGEGSDFDPREVLIGADPYWSEPPPGLQSVFAMHHVMPSMRGDDQWCRREPMMTQLYNHELAVQAGTRSGSLVSSDTGGGMSRVSALSGSSSSTTYSKACIREIKGNMRRMLTPGCYSLKKKGLLGRGGANSGSAPAGAPMLWGGSWVPYSNENAYSRHYWLPNEAYSSSHIALCAEFTFKCENLLSQWN